MLSLTFPVTYGSCTRNQICLHALYKIQNTNLCILSVHLQLQGKIIILKLFSSLIIGSSEASYESGIIFCQMPRYLDLFSISKSVGMCFAMLKQFSKAGILNFWRGYGDSLTHFLAVSVCTLLFCNNSLTMFTLCVPAVSVPASKR